MTSHQVWSGHGLEVRCDGVSLDLRPGPEGSAGAAAAVIFHLNPPGPVPPVGAVLGGTVLAHVVHGSRSEFSVVRRPGSQGADLVDVCFHGLALATIDEGTWSVGVTLEDGVDQGIVSVLVSGALLAVVLTLQGHPVLHASAVVTGDGPEGRAVAFIGSSGMGKSTMATLMCRDGATLLADDVLRTDIDSPGSVTAWPGATATRLRPAAEDLAREVSLKTSATADGRHSAEMALAPDHPVPLRALIVPQPDRSAASVQLTRLQGVEAVMAIARFPRILGWTDPATSAVAHRHWGELARRVPILTATIPWGPPFVPGLGAQVLASLDSLGV